MRKNILFITADQFRHDALGLCGAFPVKTPNLDRLADSGCLFENAYCGNPLCTPSRASIMTGRQSFQHGVYYNDQNWPRGLPTIPGMLSENGCYSVKVGPTHFQPPLLHGGFDKIVGNFDLKHRFDPSMGERDLPGWAGVLQSQYAPSKTPPSRERFEPVVHTNEALKQLHRIVGGRHCKGIDATEPFFMWVSYLQPHTPCNPPEPYFSMYPPEAMREAVKSAEEIECFAPQLKRGMKYWEPLDEEMRRSFMARYLGSITLLDELIGELLAFLEEEGLMENTLVVFTSDHGDYLGDHHLQQKGFFHDCSSKVPLIFNGPEIAAGRRVAGNVSLVDLLSTFLDYSALLMPDHRDPEGRGIYDQGIDTPGISLLPAMSPADEPDPARRNRVVVAESGIYGYAVMLKQGGTKINCYPESGHWDHFETDGDPRELNNLAGGKRPQLTPEMESTLQTVLRHSGNFKGRYYWHEKRRPMFS